MSAPALSRPAVPLSVCDACDGDYQKRYEPLKFNGFTRDWLCASCRDALLDPPAPRAPAPWVGGHTGVDDTNGDSCPR